MKPIIPIIAALLVAGCVNESAWNLEAGYVPQPDDKNSAGPNISARDKVDVRTFSMPGSGAPMRTTTTDTLTRTEWNAK